MSQAKQGDTVKVHYTGKLKDGTEFDSSKDRDPLQFKIGDQQVIPGFEQAVIGMEVGHSKEITIPENEAYGPHREEMVISVDKKRFQHDFEIEVGQDLQVHQPDGQVILVKVVDVTDNEVTLDANHPLAGNTLIFNIQLVEIV